VLWFHLLCCSIVILCNIFVFSYYNRSGTLQVVSEHFPWKKLWVIFFFRVETYSNILKLQRSVIQHINPWSGKHTCKELQVVLKHTLLATLVTPVGTPSSGSTSDNTCIWINLDILKPSIDKPIGPPDCYSSTKNNTWEDTL
jgi:hypothetical protein